MSNAADPIPPPKTRKPRGPSKQSAHRISLLSDPSVVLLKFETQAGPFALISFDQILEMAKPAQRPVLETWYAERRADEVLGHAQRANPT